MDRRYKAKKCLPNNFLLCCTLKGKRCKAIRKSKARVKRELITIIYNYLPFTDKGPCKTTSHETKVEYAVAVVMGERNKMFIKNIIARKQNNTTPRVVLEEFSLTYHQILNVRKRSRNDHKSIRGHILKHLRKY